MNSTLNYKMKSKRQQLSPKNLGLVLSLPKQIINTYSVYSPPKQKTKKMKTNIHPKKEDITKIANTTIHTKQTISNSYKNIIQNNSKTALNKILLFNSKSEFNKTISQPKHKVLHDPSFSYYQIESPKQQNMNNDERILTKDKFFMNLSKKEQILRALRIQQLRRKQKKIIKNDQNNQQDKNIPPLPNFPSFNRSRSTFYSSKNSQLKIINILRKTIIATKNNSYHTFYKKKRGDEPLELQITKANIINKVNQCRSTRGFYSFREMEEITHMDGTNYKQFLNKQKRKRKDKIIKIRNKSRSQIRGWDIEENYYEQS